MRCPAPRLTAKDLAIYELDAEGFAVAVGRAFGFAAAEFAGVAQAAPKMWPAGVFADTRSPVYLALCPNEVQLLASLEGVAGICDEPFIVLAPTAPVRSELVASFLQRHHCGFIPLTSLLVTAGPGKFRVTGTIAPVLGRLKARIVAKGDMPSPAKMQVGRLEYSPDFNEVWFGGKFYDLSARARARHCIQYLVEHSALDARSARHLEREIDPYVCERCQLPRSADIRIQHYFNGDAKLRQLRRDLVRAAGRNGRFYLDLR
jgi:hypothetical protein